jgi:hypothetical protein
MVHIDGFHGNTPKAHVHLILAKLMSAPALVNHLGPGRLLRIPMLSRIHGLKFTLDSFSFKTDARKSKECRPTGRLGVPPGN